MGGCPLGGGVASRSDAGGESVCRRSTIRTPIHHRSRRSRDIRSPRWRSGAGTDCRGRCSNQQWRSGREGGRALEDAELVERARTGDAHAYELLVGRYQKLAFRVAYLTLGGAAEAEDCTQEAFVRAYYALPRFRPAAPFRPWLLQIVANEARNRRRSIGRRDHLALRLAATSPLDEATPSPEGAVLAGEDRATLISALDALRADDRRVLSYRYFLDLSEEETAAALGCARGTVKSRLSRALGRLRALLLPAPGTAPAAEADDRRRRR